MLHWDVVVLGPLLDDPDDALHLWVGCVPQKLQDVTQRVPVDGAAVIRSLSSTRDFTHMYP